MMDMDGVEHRWVRLRAGRMHYQFARADSFSPDRQPLLLIHGLLGYSFSWRFNIPALAREFPVYAPDALGAGFSDRPGETDSSLTSVATRCLQFMDGVGVESAHVIGTSHGGAIAAVMADLAPERVRRLVLAAPVNPWSAYRVRLIRVLSTRLGALAFAAIAPGLGPMHGCFLRRMYGDPRRIPQGTLEGYDLPLKIPGTLPYLLGIVQNWESDLDHLRETYKRIGDRPILLLWGELDTAVHPESARELQRRIPGSELVVLPGVGHLPYEEAPQEFNRRVLEFLQS